MAALRIYMWSVMALVFYLVQPGSSLFSWHPTLMTIGSMFIIYEGILLLVPRRGLLDFVSFETRRNIHGVIQSIGLFFMFIGFTAVAMHKNNFGKPHLQSLHSLIALPGGIGCFFLGLSGLSTRFQRLTPVKAETMRFAHVILALTTYFFICIAYIAGVFTDYMSSRAAPIFQIIIMTLPMIAFATGFTKVINRFLQIFLRPH